MPETLTTDRLTLRTFVDEDADALFDLHSRPEVQRWIGDGQPMTDVGEARASVPRRRDVPYPPPQGIWAIDLEERFVGTLLLKPIPISGSALAADPRNPELALDSPEVEIGWHLHPDVWGRGIATEAATRVLGHASDLPRIVAVTHPDNEASQRVARRLGMRDEGLTDRYYDTTTRLFVLER
ncbi:GNAT family N-acetyltransferase [Janibacter hoylei]|uniref:GNAT family N-acetyltransferase n=1 Tax=unclassified Janibacter TaxID=2649294 RepID=UPI003F92ABC6